MPEARLDDAEVATKENSTATTLGTFIPEPPATSDTNVDTTLKISSDPQHAVAANAAASTTPRIGP